MTKPHEPMHLMPEDLAPQARQSLSILLVEDSPLQQQVLAHQLKQLGHSVSLASDGFDALSAVQQDSSYDVVLMDCQMPLMDGFHATKYIREAQRVTGRPQIAIIGISASSLPEECFASGMDDFLRKPINKNILKAVLGRCVRAKSEIESPRAKRQIT